MDRELALALRRFRRELVRTVLDHCAPPSCAACGGASEAPLCLVCRLRLEQRGSRAVCPRCGEPTAPGTTRCVADHGWLIGIRDLQVPWRYRGTGGAVVRRQKFERDPVALQCVGRAVAGYLEARARVRPATRGLNRPADHRWKRAVFVAVPGSRSRLRRRGFDHAEDLARAVAHRLGAAFESAVLRRNRDTLPQADPRVMSRARNVEGAFEVRRPRRVVGRHVVLVDDVVTSGATVRACTRVLRAVGARAVTVAAVALGTVKDDEGAAWGSSSFGVGAGEIRERVARSAGSG